MARSTRLESGFQDRLIDILHSMFVGCEVIKVERIQGFSDLLILYGDKWAALECKRSPDASHRPNQDYYIDKLDYMSFGRFVDKENMEEVLNDLQLAFRS